jgi:nucleotide-binding universal stress UspA family protein
MGDPAKEIIRLTAEAKIDLIMMPTRGCGRFRQLLLGSVTAKVLDDATCPVWTDAHMDQGKQPVSVSMKNIVCAVDGHKSATTTERALDLAKTFSATLRLIHVIPEIDITPEVAKARWEAQKDIGDFQDQEITDPDVCIRRGTVSEMIRQAALENNADLLVIGRGHLQAFLGRLRTHAYAIIRDSPCPVLSV